MMLGVVYSHALFSMILIFISHTLTCNCSQYESQFQEFLIQFKKTYKNDTAEYQKRLQIFQMNYKISQLLNHNRTDNNSALFGITKFADLSFDEFREVYLSDYVPFHLPPATNENSLKLTSHMKPHPIQELPKRVDWREKHKITKVKDQGECGGCWAFSSIELMESRYAQQVGHLEEFSIQEVLDCSRSIKTPYGGLSGCEGGQLCAALFWLNQTQTTIVPETKYRFQDKDEYCMMVPKSAPGIKLRDYACFNYMDHEVEVLKYLATGGPVSVAVDATNWHNYLGGIIQYHCPANLNHAVQIVGYDLSGPVPYYIVRNSWGEDWGLDGYVHIKYGENMCGIATEVTMVTDLQVS